MKRILALVVCVMVLCCMYVVPPAQAVLITPYFTYISTLQAGIAIIGSTASCWGSVATSSANDVSIKVTLLRQSGSTWVTVASWYAYGYGIDGASVSRTYSLSIPGNYKVHSLGKVLDSNGNVLEAASAYSGINTY